MVQADGSDLGVRRGRTRRDAIVLNLDVTPGRRGLAEALVYQPPPVQGVDPAHNVRGRGRRDGERHEHEGCEPGAGHRREASPFK